MAFLLFFPGLFNLYMSFQRWIPGKTPPIYFVGVKNYLHIFMGDTRFWNSIFRVFYFTALAVPLALVLGYLIANLFNREFKGKRIFRTLILLPMVGTPVAVALIWRLMYNPMLGIANYLLEIVRLPPSNWIGSQATVIPSLALVSIWQGTPLVMLIILAALQSLPSQFLEAAKLDGASYFQYVRHIQLPLIKPHIIVALIFRLIDSLKVFDIIFVMTRGGPGRASETLNLYTFLQAFFYFEIGYASALAVILFGMVLMINLILIRIRVRAWSY